MEVFNKFNQNMYDYQLKGNLGLEDVNDNRLIDLITKFNKLFKKESQNFAELCFLTYRVNELFVEYRKSGKYLLDKHKNPITFDEIMKGFGFDSSQSSRLLACYNKYCCLSESDIEKATCKIICEYENFSKSKLIELLPVDNEQLFNDIKSKVVRPDMTVKQIRDYVKNYYALQKQKENLFKDKEEKVEEEFDESEIPMVYDPTKYYEFSYFESKTKSQLLNMIWDLQKEYLKLKEKNKK